MFKTHCSKGIWLFFYFTFSCKKSALQCHLQRTSNTPCVGGLHLQLTFWKAVTCWQRKNSGVTWQQREFKRWPKRPNMKATVDFGHIIYASEDDASQRKSNRNATMAHSSSSGLHLFIPSNTPSTHRSAPVHLQTCLPSLPLVTEHTARTRAHIRRAGGSTLSAVRNNSFWPSPACALKWSPWVAAYQRGRSYRVGGGHYTTWLQNLHRPLQRPGSLSERNPRFLPDLVLIENGW